MSLESQEDTASSRKLRSEIRNTAQSVMITAWVQSAMLYLSIVTAYIGAVIGLVTTWRELINKTGQEPDFTVYAIAGVLVLPLLFALLFNLLPALRRRRERKLRPVSDADATDTSYFQTGPRLKDHHGFFAQGYEPFLNWTREPAEPLLHLTGLSGSGKSSLLCAYLQPRLIELPEGPRIQLLIVRSYDHPLEALKAKLLQLWKKPPSDYDTLSPLGALHRASRQLSGEERLMIAFDQFEEFFLLRANPDSTSQRSSEPKAHLADKDLLPLREFFAAFLSNPISRVTLLLSYREDHRRLLNPLELPLRKERINWMTVDPLDFATAKRFLQRCPGLTVPEERLGRVLKEAARQEGGRVVMRPIVANLLGLILQKMSDHPTLWQRSDDLLRGYVKDCLGNELREERILLLRALLTDFHTIHPRSIAEIADKTNISIHALDIHLEHLGRAGLVRCVSSEAKDSSERVWQISHDFLAILIERMLDSIHRTIWRNLRPWTAPLALNLWILVFLFQPVIQKNRDITDLSNVGFIWNETRKSISAVTWESRKILSLRNFSDIIHRMRPKELNFAGSSLTNVDGIERLNSIQKIDLSGCRFLHHVDGLSGLDSLEVLNLSGCSSLRSIVGLRRLNSLENLILDHCESLNSVEGLSGLKSLRTLYLNSCKSLKNIDGLRELPALHYLDLRYCLSLENIDGLQGVDSLESIYLSHCKSLRNVDSLKGKFALQNLYLDSCSSLVTVDGLQGLRSLKLLYLSSCKSLKDVDGLKGLSSLQFLHLNECISLQNIDGLSGLNSIKYLDISYCSSLRAPKFSPSDLNTIKSLDTLESVYAFNLLSQEDFDFLQNSLPQTGVHSNPHVLR